jgi:hypothetical protein
MPIVEANSNKISGMGSLKRRGLLLSFCVLFVIAIILMVVTSVVERSQPTVVFFSGFDSFLKATKLQQIGFKIRRDGGSHFGTFRAGGRRTER